MEAEIHKLTQSLGVGAQFGGKYFCHDVRVIRLPRHGASLPIGLGVSCSADRQAKGKITKDGIFIEQLETEPAKYMPEIDEAKLSEHVIKIDLNRPMKDVLAELTKHPVKTQLSLTGTIIVARDLAHAKIRSILEAGGEMPQYMKDHPVYYAGPAKTPEGMPSAPSARRRPAHGQLCRPVPVLRRLDGDARQGQPLQGRARRLCTPWWLLSRLHRGPAARLAQDCIKKVEVLEFPELGMEAVWKIEVENFPPSS